MCTPCDCHLDCHRLIARQGAASTYHPLGLQGFALHRELEMYVQAGIPAPDVLRIATLNAAKVLEREAQLGSIAPGKLADMILMDGDPAR